MSHIPATASVAILILFTLRPLAYSTLADLIHHVRSDLSLQQLVRVVSVYACISHDSTFPFNIQTMCSKLTQACIESICQKGDKAEAIRVMQGVLLTTVEKLKSTYKAFDRMKQAAAQDEHPERSAEENQKGREGYDAYDWRSIERVMPVSTVAYASDSMDTILRGELSRCDSCVNEAETRDPQTQELFSAPF